MRGYPAIPYTCPRPLPERGCHLPAPRLRARSTPASKAVALSVGVQVPSYHSHVRSDVFHLLPGRGSLLDVGGGDGATAAEIKRRGLADRVGVMDAVPPADPAAVDFSYQGDIVSGALLDRAVAEQGLFDTIVTCDFLEHVADPWSLVDKLADCLKPGGLLVVAVPNIRNYHAVLPLVFKGRFDYVDAGILDRTHLRFFTRHSAAELIRRPMLDAVSFEAQRSGGRKNLLLDRMSLGLLGDFFTERFIMSARRRA